MDKNFSNQLNYYIEKIGCSSKDISTISGLSPAVISRYRNGERVPSLKNSGLENLAEGLYNLAIKKNILNISKDEIFNTFIKSLNNNTVYIDSFRLKFNEIITLFSINISELARVLNFDSSYISRIRTGKRSPSNLNDFIKSLCKFIVTKYNSDSEKKSISALLDCDISEIMDNSNYLAKLQEWFLFNQKQEKNNVDHFLKKLDEFDLNEYIKIIHFDTLKVPSLPFYKHNSKNYYGTEQMKQGELDFFKSTVLSKSNEPIFMCNDMPMEDMSNNDDFPKKWMFAIAMCLKKGLHLDIIHNLERPFNELMLGLEGWIPIYMTGQVSPYYIKGIHNNVYCHFNYVSGKVALTGESISGYHNNGKYYLTSNSEEVSFYRTKAKNLLSKASPLMDIYTIEDKNSFNSFILKNSKIKGKHRRLLSTLPIYTISDELITRILDRNNISEIKQKELLDFVHKEREVSFNILENNTITDEYYLLTKEDFEKEKYYLFLANSFFEEKIEYTYEDYLTHLEQTKIFKKENKNYNFTEIKQSIFKNIQINIFEGKWIMISKSTNPCIHFVINHPTLRNAIENFSPLILD